jgi:hypothetical protein
LSSYLGAITRPVCHVHEFFNHGWIYLLVFAGEEERGDTGELELAAPHNGALDETVYHIDGEEKCLGLQLKFVVNRDEPVDQDGTHLLVDLGLVVQV